MILEIRVIHHLVYEARGVRNASLISLGIGTVQRQVEVEVGIFLLQLMEIFQEEGLAQAARSIEEVHFTVTCVQSLRHVHNLRSQGSHAGTTAHPYHLLLGVEDGMEVTIRTAHDYLVAWLAGEYVGRSDTRRHVLEAHLWTGLEGSGGDTHGQGDAIALGGIIRHGVCPHSILWVMRLEREDIELLPSGQVFLPDVRLVEILVIVYAVVSGNLDLSVGTRNEVHMLTRRKRHDKFLDEGGHVLVGNDRALPLLHAEDALVHVYFHVSLHLALASQTPVVLDLLAGEMGTFRVEYLAAALQHLHFALSTAGLSAAG